MARKHRKTPITDEARSILRGGPPPSNIAGVDVTAIPPTVATLNSLAIFRGRIVFESLRLRGSMTQARFAGGAEAIWRTMTDLTTFGRSQVVLFEGTGILIPTPSARKIRATWEPVAQLIRRVAEQDAVVTGPGLQDEFAQIIRSTWERAGRPIATDNHAFLGILRECNLHQRNHAGGPPPCCVWIGEGHCWIHQPSLLDWLSCPVAKSKHYPWDDVRTALLLLDFVPRELNRSLNGEGIHVRAWRGPLDLLADDETKG